MAKFSAMRSVPYSVEQIFGIAGNVADYPAFLPLVKRSVVTDMVIGLDGKKHFIADLQFAYPKLGISDSLRSRVVVDPAACTVTATSNEGPVKSLISEWKILARATGGSDIHFTVDYTLKSRSLQFLLSGMFDLIVRRIMTAFEERARALYGAPVAA
ncbi:MAG: type II toxin-antitoxin system RatA family toxin [Rhizobiales bacterium]|nr:type II toxin-antitoxin system RatA family toxin [Hyphomicrobiales bacterium]